MPAKAGCAALDPYTATMQWSRRCIGLKLFLSLAHHGASGQAGMIEHQSDMGRLLRVLLEESGWRIVNSSPLPLICFTRDGLDVPSFLAALKERQIAWMSEVKIRGEAAVRACVTSYRTTEEDIRWVVGQINQLAGECAASAVARQACQ